MRQLIIARKDLQMSPGKLAAQCCHASIAFLTSRLRDRDAVTPITVSDDQIGYVTKMVFTKELYDDWICGVFTKTICEARNRNHLMKAVEIAKELGLFDRVMQNGWGSLSAKETGRIGGILAKRRNRERQDAKNAEG